MPLIFYMVFAILLMFSILFISSVLTSKTKMIETFSTRVRRNPGLSYMKKIQDAFIDIETKIIGSINHVKKGVGNITKTLLDMNLMQIDDYNETVSVLFDDARLEKNLDKIHQNIVNEYNATKPSEKNIRILNFVIFDKSETTPKPYTTHSYMGEDNIFPNIKSYANNLQVINSELRDLFEVSTPLSDEQKVVFKKLVTRLKDKNTIDIIKKLKAFRKRYMNKSKKGDIEFDSKLYKDWVNYYPDNDFYTNDELDAFLKRRVKALVETLEISSEYDM